MKFIEILKSRISKDGTMYVQNEGGFFEKERFQWNPPATDEEIKEFESVIGRELPKGYKKFLKISNGALLFEDIQYGQWGCRILSLDEILEETKKLKSMDLNSKDSWLVFSTWLGDLDVLIYDLEENCLIDGEQGNDSKEWMCVRGSFENWLDRLIVAQGAKYWRWH